MKNLNVWTGTGNLVRDVELSRGNGPARFSIAVNGVKKQGDAYVDDPSFFDVVYWHKSALPFLLKGRPVLISGRLQQERWQDRETGANRSRIVIVAEEIENLSRHEEGQGRAESWSGAKPYGGSTGQGAAIAATQDRGRQGPPDDFPDDIPF